MTRPGTAPLGSVFSSFPDPVHHGKYGSPAPYRLPTCDVEVRARHQLFFVAVRRLIRKKGAQLYLHEDGVDGIWTEDIALATNFPDIPTALAAKRRLCLEQVELVLKVDGCSPSLDMVMPLGDS